MEMNVNKKNEYGALIVEASIVFPVMFLVIFFMIFVGNAYLQKCRIEKLVNEFTIEGAAYCGDPFLLGLMEDTPSIPAVKDYNAQPYAMILTGDTEAIELKIEEELEAAIKALDTGLFKGMTPEIKVGPIADYQSIFIYSTFTVDVECEVTIPIRLLGQDEYTLFKISNHTEMPVQDVAEFMRNFDMVEDYLESTGLKEKITDKLNEVKEFFSGKDKE